MPTMHPYFVSTDYSWPRPETAFCTSTDKTIRFDSGQERQTELTRLFYPGNIVADSRSWARKEAIVN